MYIKKSLGFEDTSRPLLLCKLQKSIHDLKYAPRSWYQKLSCALTDLGFQISKVDPNIKVDNELTMMLIYVDDILLTRSNVKFLDQIVSNLNDKFAFKFLGDVHYFLGLEV